MIPLPVCYLHFPKKMGAHSGKMHSARTLVDRESTLRPYNEVPPAKDRCRRMAVAVGGPRETDCGAIFPKLSGGGMSDLRGAELSAKLGSFITN